VVALDGPLPTSPTPKKIFPFFNDNVSPVVEYLIAFGITLY
jgi:hypothetical protein